MATRGNRPKAPEDTKGGVRGTHGLGDKLRISEEERGNVATQGGTASVTGGSRKGGTAHESRLGWPVPGEADRTAEMTEEDLAELRAGGEELAELSAGTVEEPSGGAVEEPSDVDELSEEEMVERHLATQSVHGPGPKDVGRGSATRDHLAEHGLSDEGPAGRRTKRGATNAVEDAPRKR